jgi:hypothetical protein
MGLLHYQNVPINIEKQNLFQYIQELEQLSRMWVNPIFKFDRIIFSVPGAARHFLTKLPGTSWGKINWESELKTCSENCNSSEFLVQKSKYENFEITHFPIVRCNPALMFQISSLLQIFPLNDDGFRDLRFELLAEETTECKQDLKMILQDFWTEWKISNPPRCSYIHTQYEVNLGQDPKTLKHPTRRTRRPPATFQRWLQKIAPQWYPASIGNEYYGKSTFSFFIPYLVDGIPQISKYFPPAPMKYYDFLQSEQIELRFEEWISNSLFFQWLKDLHVIEQEFPNALVMVRVKVAYDAWDSENDHKSAGQDEFWITWNDIEFAFKHQNRDFLKSFNSTQKIPSHLSFFFNLTPKIEDSDFRIAILEDIFHHSVRMR